MNKDKVYLKGYVIGRAADTLGYEGLMVQLENLDVVEIDKNLVHRDINGPQKVTVPQFVADWIEKNKGSLFGLNYDSVSSEIYDWVYEEEGNLKKLHLACAIGYTVEKEKRYIVKMSATKQPLFYNNMYEKTFFSLGDLATRFTRKQLEGLGLGWVFDCPGIEIEEATE
nr:MAG TPA: Protein of unknown function (DUF1642) [Caudoviricetes sp.]